MKKQQEKEERFKEILDDACNMHMLKNVLYIKSRFSFEEGYMFRQPECDRWQEKLKMVLEEREELIDSRNKIACELFDLKKELETTIKVMQNHHDEQDKLIFELTEENKKLKNEK